MHHERHKPIFENRRWAFSFERPIVRRLHLLQEFPIEKEANESFERILITTDPRETHCSWHRDERTRRGEERATLHFDARLTEQNMRDNPRARDVGLLESCSHLYEWIYGGGTRRYRASITGDGMRGCGCFSF